MDYSHTQKVPNEVMTVAALAGLAVGLTPPGFLLRLALLGTLGAAASTFRSLTVEINNDTVYLKFGDGLLKRTINLRDVESAHVIRTTPLQGWGMHWTGNGWLYNVYGLDAVELRFIGGKNRVLIGTDDQVKLANVISDRLKRMSIEAPHSDSN